MYNFITYKSLAMNWLYDFLPENIVHALGWTVIHSLWQGLLIGAILALSMMTMQEKTAALRYRLSFGALLLMCLSSVVTFAFLFKKSSETTRNDLLEALILRGGIFENTLSDAPTLLEKATLFFNENAPFVVLTWLIGVAFFSLRLIGGLLFIQQLRTRQLVFLDDDWQNRVTVFKNKLNINRAVGLAESALVAVPMTLGWLKPLILLPIGTVNNMTVGQVEAILAHELAHIAGRDYLLNILQSVIEIIFYFNPAVWFISATIRAERENRCDDIAVNLSNNALTYAKALLSLQEMQRPDSRLFGLTLTFADNRRKGFLLKRIKRILNQPHNRSQIMEKLTATGLLLAVVTALSFGSNKFLNPQSPTERQDTPTENVVEVPPSVASSLAMTDEQNSVLTKAFDVASDLVSTASDILGNDTLPKRRGTVSIKTDDYDGKAVKLEAKEGKITELEVDGKSIPKEEFDKYRDLTDDIFANLPTPPVPPTPPMPPTWATSPTPPTPPTPPSGNRRFPVPPTPPMPPAPPAPPVTLRKFKDAQGNTIIKMTKKDGTTSEIKVTPEKEVFVDGKKMEEGSDLELELNDKEGSDFELILPHAHYSWFGNGVHIHTSDNDDSSRVIKINPKIKNRIRLKGYNSKLFEGGNTRFRFHFNSDQLRNQTDSMSREVRKMAQSYRIDAEKLRHDAQKMSKSTEKYWYTTTPYRDGKTQKEIIEKQLKEDGYLKEGKKKYKLELTDKFLKINGEKMSADVYQRYFKLLSNDYRGTFRFVIEEDTDE
jgi:bla regulator protein blaR1